jgi:iron complex outermembrane receptor protein
MIGFVHEAQPGANMAKRRETGRIQMKRSTGKLYSKTGLLLGGAASALLSGAATQTCAQTTTLQEVIVTAQRREQRLQDVPISVSAITQKQLVANRIENVHDLTAIAPNLTVQESAGGVNLPAFAMRGLQSYGVATGSDKEISIYLDGVYLGSSTGSMFDVADLASIEVLKGPQGTLFGRNSTGGAINITTRDPAGRFKFHQELTGGNYDQFRSKTRIDTPEWKGLSAALTFFHSQRRGDVRNTGGGTVWDYRPVGEGLQTSPNWLGGHNINAVTAAVKWQPVDNFTLTYKYDWSEDHATPVANGLAAVYPPGLQSNVGGPLNPIAGLLEDYLLTNNLAGAHLDFNRPKSVYNPFTIPSYNQASGHNLTAVWHPTDDVTIKNIFAFRKAAAWAAVNIDGDTGTMGPQLAPFLPALPGAPYAFLETTTIDDSRQWSDELQVVYNSKWMTLTSGVLYFWSYETHNGIGDAANEYALTPIPFYTITPTGIPTSHVTEKSQAFYIQPEFHITSQLTFTVGYRITHDMKNNYFATLPLGGPLLQFSSRYADTKPSTLFSLDYKFTPDIMVYGKYSAAYMSGGQSFTLNYLPEIAKSWEAGAKTEFFDRRVRANLALWTVKYTNMQTAVGGDSLNPPQPNLAVVVVNSGNIDAKGVELEGAILPIPRVTLGYGVGYTTEHYTFVNPALLAPPPLNSGVFNAVERPKWTGNVSAEYDSKPIWNDAYVMARVDANFRGREYLIAYAPTGTGPLDLTPGASAAPSAWTVNGRLALTHITLPQGTGDVALWAKNILDNKTPEYGVGTPFLESVFWTPARTFGIDVTFDF